MPRIDAHQHYWVVARGDYGWLPATGPLHRDYLPADLAPCNKAADIAGTVLVQAAPTVAETKFLLGLADQPANNILGVVGWVALDSDEAAAQLEELAQHPKLVSIRPMLHDLPQADWILQPRVIENLRRLPALNLRFDVLTFPQHLPFVIKALEQVPELTAVIDHLSKPRYGSALASDWQKWMRELAQETRIFCKLSGMVTEVGPDWKVEDFADCANLVLSEFGPERVMFGSDWPVCLKVATHSQVVNLAEQLTASLDTNAQAEIWGNTARRFYLAADSQ